MFERFQDGHHNILVATDIASRGLDTINVSYSATWGWDGVGWGVMYIYMLTTMHVSESLKFY